MPDRAVWTNDGECIVCSWSWRDKHIEIMAETVGSQNVHIVLRTVDDPAGEKTYYLDDVMRRPIRVDDVTDLLRGGLDQALAHLEVI